MFARLREAGPGQGGTGFSYRPSKGTPPFSTPKRDIRIGRMSLQLGLVLACGLVALLYGAWLVRELLALSPGTREMQEIAAAIQEGASAYLNRQYITIAIAGAVIFAAAFYLGWQVAVGYLIGAT